MDESNPPTRRPLPILRALIDAVDREVLGLLARRSAIVSEVAEYKREHRIGVRDFKREREILDDRRSRAERLGLSPEAIESMWRLILMASRDQQAALKVEVPRDVEQKTVAVVGGKGKMGALFAQLFADLGHAVLVVDVDTDLKLAQAAVADVVVVSVPIEKTLDVIREVGPLLRPDALLMDLTSIKQAPVETMLASTRASVVGTHPMFGPKVHSLQGQRVVVCPGRGAEWDAWLRRQLQARGLLITEATPERHDQVMSVVQVLTHFQTQVVGLALSRLGIPLDETLAYTSPVYLMELLFTGRHFAQSPELYGAIEMLNPRTAEVTATFQQAARDLGEVIGKRDKATFGRLFEEVRRHFGDFTRTALEQSSFLIDRLVERS